MGAYENGRLLVEMRPMNEDGGMSEDGGEDGAPRVKKGSHG